MSFRETENHLELHKTPLGLMDGQEHLDPNTGRKEVYNAKGQRISWIPNGKRHVTGSIIVTPEEGNYKSPRRR